MDVLCARLEFPVQQRFYHTEIQLSDVVGNETCRRTLDLVTRPAAINLQAQNRFRYD